MEPACECTERTAAFAQLALFEMGRLTNGDLTSVPSCEVENLKAALISLVEARSH